MKLNLVLVGLVSVGAICGLDDYRLSSHAQEQPDSSAPITTAYEPSADPAANAAVTKLNPLLQNFAKQNPQIYGILLMADGDLETQKLVDAELIIDESQTAIDQKPILAVLNAELKPAQYQLKTTKHPAAKLLAEIQKRVTSTSELGNVQIQGIRYETNAGGGLTLKILGYRTANASTDAAMQLDALTTIATAAIEELILELKKDFTVVIVTHSMSQAARVSDYTGFMYLGRLVEFGETDKIFSDPDLELTKRYITGRFG